MPVLVCNSSFSLLGPFVYLSVVFTGIEQHKSGKCQAFGPPYWDNSAKKAASRTQVKGGREEVDQLTIYLTWRWRSCSGI
ncbi:hypothetical protein XELAEV_18010240mg [Xenopus laevis]|uniref:Secreted protein n=1 Tax=Xenopus laevis TaxID=8355 RepID=A0A974I148_XENLA|nr:hypothetical protein XELAEV_18010240mg [Xenopus laevis]